MNRLAVYAFLLTLCLAPVASVGAQSSKGESLEQTYARLCANGQKNEACGVLRAALLKKLAGDAATTPGSPTPSSTKGASTSPESSPVSPRWGFWAQLAGTSWFGTDGGMFSYSWRSEGEVLSADAFSADTAYNAVFTLSPKGSSLDLRIGSDSYVLEPHADGSFTQRRSESLRTRYALSGDKITLVTETLADGRWAPGQSPPISRRRLAANEIDGYRAALAQRRQERDAIVAREWGIVPKLIGHRFLSESKEYPQYNSVMRFVWLDRGTEAALIWDWLSTGEQGGWMKLTRDTATGKFVATEAKGERGDVSMTADGRVRIAWDPTPKTKDYGTVVSDYYITDGTLRFDGYFVKNGRKDYSSTISYATVTGKSYAQLRTAHGQQRQQAAQQAAKTKAAKKSGGGLWGAVQGVAAGMAGVTNAGGGLSEAVVGGAIGAVAGSAGVDAATIATSTQLAAGGAPSTIAGAAAPTGSVSYPTKPNALSGQAACSMMNESNYRQVGVSGGDDAQLKTMCAQSYEYYVNYKRAIAQGYSEADANRTYSAHEQSARVAIHFYQNNR